MVQPSAEASRLASMACREHPRELPGMSSTGSIGATGQTSAAPPATNRGTGNFANAGHSGRVWFGEWHCERSNHGRPPSSGRNVSGGKHGACHYRAFIHPWQHGSAAAGNGHDATDATGNAAAYSADHECTAYTITNTQPAVVQVASQCKGEMLNRFLPLFDYENKIPF